MYMSNFSVYEYVSFCNEYQRQMNEIIKTQSSMSNHLYSLLNIQNNETDTNANINQTNDNETNVERANNVNITTQNTNTNTNARTNTRTQPRINIGTSILYPQRIPVNRTTSTIPRNVTTHTMYTTGDNMSDNNAYMNEITRILGYSPDSLNSNLSNIFNDLFTTMLNQPLQNTEDVVVRPTTEQIDNATEIVRYADIEDPSHECCPISYTRFNNDDEVIRIKHCKHYFNKDNIKSWFNYSVKCPLCRYDIREYVNEDEDTPQNSNNIDENNIDENNIQSEDITQ